MSTDPATTAILRGQCAYCGNYHTGICPRVKAIEYHPNGLHKRVEFFDVSQETIPATADSEQG